MSNISNHEDVDYALGYILLSRLIVWGYIGLVLSIFGIIGNIITILVLISPSMRTTSTNIYLTALSCSNILFLFIFIPTYSVKYLLGYSVYMSNQPPFAFEILLTRLPTTPVYNTILLSIIYLTIAVSMDRLILIRFPLKAKHILTKRTTLITILMIYIFSIVYCIPYWLEQRYIPEENKCRLTKIGEKIYKYIRIYIYIPVVYVIPFVTLTCINITIIQILITKKRSRKSLGGQVSRKRSGDYHITLMLVIIIIVFVLSELPLLVLNVWHAIDSKSYENLNFHILNSIGILLMVLNTSTNFLLYCFFGQKFRQTLIQSCIKTFSNKSKKFNVNTRSSNQIPLSSSSKLIHSKSIEQTQQICIQSSSTDYRIPIRTSNDELHPLLKSTIVHLNGSSQQITSIDEKSQLDSNADSSANEKQLLALKI